MALTETAYHARQTIKFGAIFIVAAIALRFLWVGGFALYRTVFPPAPPPPEVKFNKLPALVFEPRSTTNQLTYNLEVPGGLPTMPIQANVFFMPTPQASFLNLDESNRLAKALGFNSAGLPLSEVIYRFDHTEIPASLDVNIVNKTVSLSYNLALDSALLSAKPRSNQEAISAARSFLSRGSLLVTDLELGRQELEFLKSSPEALTRVTSLSDANFVRVNFLRKNYDDLPVITSRIDRGTVWLLVTGESSGPKQVIAGEYHYFPVDEEQKSTYPIKTSTEAFEELKAGRGLTISPPSSGNAATIRRIYLGYYDSGKPQQYLQPVFVFDGDREFRAIVPAVTSQYYGN